MSSMASAFTFPLFLFFFYPVFIPICASDEAEILLSFKATIEDPMHSLSTWSNTSLTPLCNWTGVTCSPSPFFSVTSLNLQGLNLSGEISSSICELPSLSYLNLANNFFNTPIPLHLSQCSALETLNLSNNLVWGTIPDQISQFISLRALDLSRNHVEGKIPYGLGSLMGLEILNLGSNSLSGSVTSSVFGNLSELVVLDLSGNPLLSSEIPGEVGKLDKLQQLLLQSSGFHGVIPDTFVGLRRLEVLDLSRNNLTGGFPLGLGFGLENLIFFDVSENKLSGSFPAGICRGKGLTNFMVYSNLLTGSIPDSFNECLNLERFQVQNNGFWGKFPDALWSLPKIKLITAENNRFSGEIPESISMAAQLEQVHIDNNSFISKIPRGLGRVRSLYRFSASLNGLYGDIPENFCDSPIISIINLSHNSLMGRIPELTKCRNLVSLSLADNSLTGEIPTSLAQLPVLTFLDLSNNNLTGPIPEELQNLKLALFNVSYNQLSGRVPSSLISGFPASFLQGNPDLCGPGLPSSCLEGRSNSIGPTKLTCVLISIAFAGGLMVVAAGIFVMYRSYKWKSHRGTWCSVLYFPLRVTEQDLIMGMDEKSVMGSGGAFGRVYILRLPGGEFVAVKKLMNFKTQSRKALKAEIKTLAKIRHKNITKLMGFFYSEDSILLIYEFVHRGSLGDLICRSDLQLEWSIRLRIAIGTAQGLAYLHKEYIPHLLHRNIKSTNILLDADFEPKITDFALDRIVGESVYVSSMASDPGSYCYLAPEHAYSKKATEQMDVYSFGVVLLELITGRQAEQTASGDSGDPMDIVKWVRRKVNMANGALQVLDRRVSNTSQHEMLGALEVALRCTSVMPEKRPTMFEVVRSLQSLDSKARLHNVFSVSVGCCSTDEHSEPGRA